MVLRWMVCLKDSSMCVCKSTHVWETYMRDYIESQVCILLFSIFWGSIMCCATGMMASTSVIMGAPKLARPVRFP